jgi:hypothetical protein
VDNLLRELVVATTPKFNRQIVDGLATYHLPKVDQYLDEVLRSGSSSFPPDLKYLGLKRCTPHQRYSEESRKRNNTRRYETAKSSLYMVNLYFSFKGVELPPKPLYLPYVGAAGTIFLGGSKYMISPVLTDKVISPGNNNVFVRLLRDKITFDRIPNYNIVINDKREITPIIWSQIYHKKQNKIKPTIKANLCIVHYLLCKYGFTEMFKRYTNANVHFGYSDTINEVNYPKSEWIICGSSGIAPKSIRKEYYTPTDIKLAVRREEFNNTVLSLISGFFYVVDHFTLRIKPDLKYLDNKRLWIILFGNILFSSVYSEQKLFEDVSTHFKSLDEYMDSLIKQELKEIGLICENVYDLFVVVLDRFNEWVLNSSSSESSMYNKKFSILYNVLESINNAYYTLIFKIRATMSRKELTELEVKTLLNQVIKPGLIYSLTRQHISMSTVSYSGDNKVPRMTCVIVPQAASSSNNAKKQRTSISSPAMRAHSSLVDIGSFCNLPKSDPSGKSRGNPYMDIDERGSVLPNMEYRELLDDLQRKIERN